MLTTLAAIALGLAALPAGLTLANLLRYRKPPRWADDPRPAMSILIPARNEAPRIADAVTAALASRDVEVEVLVMDDHSTDGTAQIVRRLAAANPALRLLTAPKLPAGWAGKPHACQALADHATSPILLFVDADVTLTPDGASRVARFLADSGADLVSGFPCQTTGSLIERLVIPLIHFVLLGFLPLGRMRQSPDPAFAAGCGQLMAVRRTAYDRMGGHATIQGTFHDGLKLPRACRQAGGRTDLFDATAVARCRMYSTGREVIFGLAKNAHEGMAGPVAIWVWSALLLGGQVLPALMATTGAFAAPTSLWFRLALAATGLGLATRVALALRFRQSWIGALLHPLGVSLLVAIQWFSWGRRRTGRGVSWKGRASVDA